MASQNIKTQGKASKHQSALTPFLLLRHSPSPGSPSWYTAVCLSVLSQGLLKLQFTGQPMWEFTWLTIMIPKGQTNKILFAEFLSQLGKPWFLIMKEAYHFLTAGLEDQNGPRNHFLLEQRWVADNWHPPWLGDRATRDHRNAQIILKPPFRSL